MKITSIQILMLLFGMLAAAAAEADDPSARDAAAAESSTDVLVVQQARIADGLVRFRTELLKMAEKLRGNDPAKAEVLEKAAQQMATKGTEDQLQNILKLLDSELIRDVDQALDKQDQVKADLTALLTLLLSGSREDRAASEKKWLQETIREIDQTIKIQRGIQGQTERSGELPDLSRRQGQLADRTDQLAKKIKDHEEAAKPAADPKPPGESKPGSDAPQPNDGSAPQPKDGQQQPEGSPPQPGSKPQPGDGKPGGGEPGMQDPSDPQQKDEQPNGRKQVEQATQKMREAQKQLDQARREGSAKQQEEAIAALEKARAELEEILRQLRDEEIEKTLVKLEARFRLMLKLQQAVYDSTVLLDRKPAAERDRTHEMEANRLARREQQIVSEVDKALLLLREDGSAVAFPEAVGQLREDLELITQRLNQAKIGSVTQRMEQDAIEAIKEMIAAVEKAQKDHKQRQQSGGRPGEAGDEPLVDAISELKMIRALQVRVNRRTAQYEELVSSKESTAADMLPRLKQLAEHEQRIHRIARDLHLGRNE